MQLINKHLSAYYVQGSVLSVGGTEEAKPALASRNTHSLWRQDAHTHTHTYKIPIKQIQSNLRREVTDS